MENFPESLPETSTLCRQLETFYEALGDNSFIKVSLSDVNTTLPLQV
jgi:hypothetical protein